MAFPVVLVHVSDIHFQRWRVDGSSYDVDADVRNELEADVERLCARIGSATGLVITGDIAHSADPREYQTAQAWLTKLCDRCGCQRDAVWTAPGNHDVDRKVTDGFVTGLVQERLRADPESLAHLLTDETGARTLFGPLKNYNDFAAPFGCDHSGKRIVWHHDLALNDGWTLRLCGLNSTLTSSRLDEPNRRLLVLGDVSHALMRESGVAVLSLCHHPTDWLIDGESIEDLLATRVHVQLFGHKHSHRARRHGSMLRVAAGATHPDRSERQWKPRYNVLGIEVVGTTDSRNLRVNLFAREWRSEHTRFVADTSESGGENSTWEIPLDPFTPRGDPTRHASTSPTSPEFPIVNSSRRLTYRFLTLPYHKRIEVAQCLGLIADEDSGLTEREQFERFLTRAGERGQLALLWREVENRHSDPAPEPNPFERPKGG